MTKPDKPEKPAKVGRPPRGKPGGMIGVSVTADERKQYEAAAKAEKLTLSQWIRAACEAFLKRAKGK